MATADNTNVLGSFLRAFQGARQGVSDRQQAAQALALNEQLKQLQIATAQAQLLEAQKTPQQRILDAVNERLSVQAALPESGISLRPSLAQQITSQIENVPGFGNISVPRPQALAEGAVPVSDAFTFNPNIPQAAKTKAASEELSSFKEKETFKESLKQQTPEAKTYTISPGQKVVDANGKVIAENPKEASDSRPIVVSPGARVIDASTGKEIFSNPSIKPADVKLRADEKKIVETLGTKNASKISIANQIDQTSLMLDDPKLDTTTKIKEGQRLLKVLNSSEGADAVGVEESKRLGSLIEYQILNLRGLIDPTQQVTGVNLPAYREQIKTASDAIKGSVRANEDVINGIYSKYGIEPSGMTSTPSNGSTQELEALQWLRSNPNDPRAPAIRKKLGI